jgi:hypothetical protein
MGEMGTVVDLAAVPCRPASPTSRAGNTTGGPGAPGATPLATGTGGRGTTPAAASTSSSTRPGGAGLGERGRAAQRWYVDAPPGVSSFLDEAKLGHRLKARASSRCCLKFQAFAGSPILHFSLVQIERERAMYRDPKQWAYVRHLVLEERVTPRRVTENGSQQEDRSQNACVPAAP